MKKPRVPLTQERVRELFDLDEDTGIMRYKVPGPNGTAIGSIASYSKLTASGYYQIYVDGVVYFLHRIIFLYVHGYMTEHQVDHISRNKLDNRPCNLREVSHSCNIRNSAVPSSNKSGVKGLSQTSLSDKWQVHIKIKGKSINLGTFKDFTEAVAHRLAAEQVLDWEGCDSCSSAFQYMQNYLNKRNK